MSKKIPLTKGEYAVVDDEDYEMLMQWKWQFDGRYARRSVWDGKKQHVLTMHRFIMNPPNDMEIDHANHDMLDNRRENLRIVTRSQNLANRRKFKSADTSKYKGLSLKNDLWRVNLKVNGQNKHLGQYSTEEAAANAYNYYAQIYFGEFAYLNDVSYIENWRDYSVVIRKKTSVFKGVSFVPDTGRWMCRTPNENNIYHYHSMHSTELEAARAFDAEVSRLFGADDPRLNFPVITPELVESAQSL